MDNRISPPPPRPVPQKPDLNTGTGAQTTNAESQVDMTKYKLRMSDKKKSIILYVCSGILFACAIAAIVLMFI